MLILLIIILFAIAGICFKISSILKRLDNVEGHCEANSLNIQEKHYNVPTTKRTKGDYINK